MTKRTVYHIIEWTIALAGCAFLIYKLATYEDYAALGESLRSMGWKEWGAMVLCVALMPVNMGLEAWRWKTLVPMSWHEANRQVYYSKLAGLITPWRLGEYPARALLQGEWQNTLSMGAVGSATMTMAIMLGGVGGLGILGALDQLDSLDHLDHIDRLDHLDQLGAGYWMIVGAVMVALIVAMAFAPRWLRRWAEVSHGLVWKSVGQSLVRLLCWCVQLGLIVWALGGLDILDPLDQLDCLGKCAVYYLLVTITPNVPIAEAGVRGAWAMVVFGSVNAALAGVILWGINTLLPCLIWPFLRKNDK